MRCNGTNYKSFFFYAEILYLRVAFHENHYCEFLLGDILGIKCELKLPSSIQVGQP